MEETEFTASMLDLFIVPAFSVRGETVEYANNAAQALLIAPGTPLAPMLESDAREYAAFTGGTLYLSLNLSGSPFGASVTRTGDRDLFVLESVNEEVELRAFALAAQQLRTPLSNSMLMVDRLLPGLDLESDPLRKEQAARLNRSLYQLLRIVSNMSDAQRYTCGQPRLESRDVNAFLEELFTQANDLAAVTGISVSYTGLNSPLFMPVDCEKLERAVYNLLSNSAKFQSSGIQAVLNRSGSRLSLTVTDQGSGIAENLRGSLFSRYRRAPAMEQSCYGIGLGMVFIRAAAFAHGGTVLVEQPENGGTRITMTMKILPADQAGLHSPLLRVDYAGERSHSLIELSDTLPADLYERDKIN